MIDFKATKQSNVLSVVHFIVIHLKTNRPTVTSSPTPIAPYITAKSEGFIAE